VFTVSKPDLSTNKFDTIPGKVEDGCSSPAGAIGQRHEEVKMRSLAGSITESPDLFAGKILGSRRRCGW
jgi:hypothetical protein